MQLTAEEARVLGCLMEKQRTTPDQYPLSVGALVTACNQSTNRHPVVVYESAAVEAALDGLREQGLVRRGMARGGRAIKFEHLAGEVLDLDPGAAAVLGVLMLRGAQTVGELKARTERWHDFPDLASVDDALRVLTAREPPLARRLEREPGQKEPRFVPSVTAPLTELHAVESRIEPEVHGDQPREHAPSIEARVAGLERRVAELQRRLGALEADAPGTTG